MDQTNCRWDRRTTCLGVLVQSAKIAGMERKPIVKNKKGSVVGGKYPLEAKQIGRLHREQALTLSSRSALCCVCSMSTSSSGQKNPVDHGVQIRFINDLCDSGGMQPGSQPKTRNQPSSKYGVAVRVQGIAGQPYVVLKDGHKGDSYGVQLRTQYPSGYSSLPRKRGGAEPGTEGADVEGGGGQGGALRRAQSHGSLLDRDGEGGAGKEDFQLSRPPGDGKSGSYGNLDGGIGVRGERELAWGVGDREGGVERNAWDGMARRSPSYHDQPPGANERPPTQRQTPVNRLINRFDGGQQRGFPPAQEPPRAASPLHTPHPYTSPHSGSRHSRNAAADFSGHARHQSPGRHPAAEAPPASLSEAQVTPAASQLVLFQ